MKIKEITDKNTWESFLLECEEKTFMQSWNWGEFHQKMGNTIWRLGVFDRKNLAGVALVAKVNAKRGTFLMVQHGPCLAARGIFNFQFSISKQILNLKSQILQIFLERLKEIAREENASFIRISPIWERSEENISIFRELGFRDAPTYAAAESSWKLDLAPSEDALLMNMRKTTRYVIRQTLKNKDIEVIQSANREDLGIFATLNKEVAARQQFVPFSRNYLESEFDVFTKDDQALLLFGKYKEEVVAAALIVFWSGIGFYHQASSKGEYAKLSIPYLLQWEAIKEAKRRGCKLYDFWGYVDPKKYPKHPWAGPTLFKMGFGGKASEYVKTQDYPLSWKYWPTAIFEMIRAKRRGL